MRTNFWTVPSCDQHNLGNKLDVEYVRNIICGQWGTNSIGQDIFEVAKRSYEYRPGLFSRTFREFRTVMVDGVKTGAFPFDMDRVEKVMNGIFHGLPWRDFGREYLGRWGMCFATLRSSTPLAHWEHLRSVLSNAPYTRIDTPYPDVFTYGVHRAAPAGFIYCLTFYGGFVVYAFPLLKTNPEVKTDSKRISTLGV